MVVATNVMRGFQQHELHSSTCWRLAAAALESRETHNPNTVFATVVAMHVRDTGKGLDEGSMGWKA